MELMRRSIAKALSWRFFATVITSTIVWILTGEFKFAIEVGILDTLVKLFMYFLHERMWLRIKFGKASKKPEFEI